MAYRMLPILLTMLFAVLSAAVGQDLKISGSAPDRIPSLVQAQVDALGKRIQMGPGGKTIYTGQFFDKDGKAFAARLIHEFPGQVRLEGFGNREVVLTFDGGSVSGITNTVVDEDLLEVFVMDSSEGMMGSLREGAAMRFLGSGFGPDPRANPDYQGPRYDIYEVTGPVRCRQDRRMRTKLFYFDTTSGLLMSTRYYDRSVTPPVKMETRYSVWGELNGSRYPARIEHYRGGQLQFTFIAESIESDETEK